MSVHYKFKAALEYDRIDFDDDFISLIELKKQIVKRKNFGGATDFDFEVKNAQTNEKYSDDSFLIPKNTSLVVRRIPSKSVAKFQKAALDEKQRGIDLASGVGRPQQHAITGKTEAEKLQALLDIGGAGYERKPQQPFRSQRGKGSAGSSNRVPYAKIPLPTYICQTCKAQGEHYANDCPEQTNEHLKQANTKKATGIPKKFLKKVSQNVKDIDPNTLVMTQDGGFAIKKVHKNVLLDAQEEMKSVIEKSKEYENVPEDLQCPICKRLYRDAVLTSDCCEKVACDSCVRDALQDNAFQCPMCETENISPDTLVPHSETREKVEQFKSKVDFGSSVESGKKPAGGPSQNPKGTGIDTHGKSRSKAENRRADAHSNNQNRTGGFRSAGPPEDQTGHPGHWGRGPPPFPYNHPGNMGHQPYPPPGPYMTNVGPPGGFGPPGLMFNPHTPGGYGPGNRPPPNPNNFPPRGGGGGGAYPWEGSHARGNYESSQRDGMPNPGHRDRPPPPLSTSFDNSGEREPGRHRPSHPVESGSRRVIDTGRDSHNPRRERDSDSRHEGKMRVRTKRRRRHSPST